MEKLEDLSNEQLRLRLLEYGLANMPVTDTTRKVLIKKLKIQMENAGSKVRRETIHVAKYSSDEDTDTGSKESSKKATQQKDNRRATIGGAAAGKLSKTLPVIPKLPPPTKVTTNNEPKPAETAQSQKRRSGRITPVQQAKEENGNKNTVLMSKEPIILENSDEEDDIPLTQNDRRNRKSKSPSLSRGEMVTTSYIHKVMEVSAKPPIAEEMEIDLTESAEEANAVPMEEEEEEIDVPPLMTPRPPTPPRPSRHTPQPQLPASYTTSQRSSTLADSSALSMTKTRYSEFPSSYGRTAPSVFSRSTTTTTTNAAATTPAKRQQDDFKFEPTDSPYLSEFTKRLSKLREEAALRGENRNTLLLDGGSGGEGTYRRSTLAASPAFTTTGYRSDYGSMPAPSSSINYHARGALSKSRPQEGAGEIRASIRQVIMALDQKYSLKRIFYTLIIIMIVIFLFVVFFL